VIRPGHGPATEERRHRAISRPERKQQIRIMFTSTHRSPEPHSLLTGASRLTWATRTLCGILSLALLLARPAEAQVTGDTAWRPITADGILRASALVDSVYIDRQLPQARVDGGDFTAYLLARVGAGAVPPDFGYRVSMDTTRVRIGGRVSDLPAEARQSLSQLIMFLPPSTWLEADVRLLPAGQEGVRFHLQGASVQGIPVPEAVLTPLLSSVGKQYPALTASGRDLYVRVPTGAGMALEPGAVRLTAP
jgi:hypothetical protein